MKALRYRLEYLLVLAAAATLRRLPLAWVQALGRGLGRAAFALGAARRTTLANLGRRLGLRGRPARRLGARACAQFAQTMLELAWMPRLKPAEISGMFEIGGLEELRAACASGRGAVCLGAHYGNWEWMGAALIARGVPLTFLIGTQSNPHVDALFKRMREQAGIGCVRIGSIRESLKVLKAGGAVALLGDQDGDKWGTFVPFFGAPASTHSIGELLARRSGAALFFGVSERLGPRRHRLDLQPLPPPPAGLGEAQAAAWTLAEYNRRLEEAVRARPEHWLWMHSRWRSLPLHRIGGEDRRRAEAGEIGFDMQAQAWKDASGQVLQPEGWR